MIRSASIGLGYSALAGLLVVVLCAATSAAEEPYRLTGVIGSNSSKLFAVIEDANGKQRLLSQGEEIDNGRVERISATDKTVVLAFPDRQLELRLIGSARPAVPSESVAATTDYRQVEDRTLNEDELFTLLELSREADSISEAESTARLNEVLNLPAEARVLAFESESAESSRQLLMMMSERLESARSDGGGFLGSLIVSKGEGNERFYLHTR